MPRTRTPHTALTTALALAFALAPWALAGPAQAQSEPLPDLAALDLTLVPAAPRAGDSVQFAAHLGNLGDASAGPFTVAFLVDGGLHANVTVTGMDARANLTVLAPAWTATEGDHDLEAIVDVDDAVEEAAEDNNVREESFDVLPPLRPDLLVLELTPLPGAPHHGQSVTFTARVRNGGDGNATPFDVGFLVGGTNLGNVTVPGLAAGAEANVTSAAWTAVAGTHTVHATADIGAVIAEHDEFNNLRSGDLTVGVAPRPDLRPVGVDVSPGDPGVGEDTTFTTVVHNEGQAAGGPFHVRFLVDGGLLADVYVASIAAGANATVTSPPWEAIAGGHTVRVMVDVNAAVPESDEDDNAAARSFTVAGPSPPPPPPPPADDDEGHEDDRDGDGGDGRGKVTLCHVPPGHPGRAHTITVGAPAAEGHRAHGDRDGPCQGDGNATAASAGKHRVDQGPPAHARAQTPREDRARDPPEHVQAQVEGGRGTRGARADAVAEPGSDATLASLGAELREVPGVDALALLGAAGIAVALAERRRR